MPAAISSQIKLKEIVYGYSEAARQSDSELLRLWRLCFTGFKQLGLNAFWQPKTEVIPVETQKIAYFPDDYIQWIKIGQFNSNNGELQTIQVNTSLTTFNADLDTRLTDITPEIQEMCGCFTGVIFGSTAVIIGNGPNGSSSRPFGLHSRLISRTVNAWW